MKQTFRISQLADLYGLNTDTIRYYESLGLLHPVRRENGYREFTITDLCDLNVIRALRELDVDMDQISLYLANRSIENTKSILAMQIEKLENKIRDMQHALSSVHMHYDRICEGESAKLHTLIIKNLKRRAYMPASEEHMLDQNLDYYLNRYSAQNRSVLRDVGNRWTRGAIPRLDSIYGSGELEYETVFFLCDSSVSGVRYFPAGTWICSVHAGSLSEKRELYDLREKYQELNQYAEDHGYKPKGPPIEFYLVDYHDSDNRKEYRTEIQLPVAKVK